MPVYNIFIINRAGSLIYDYDGLSQRVEIEKSMSYPLYLTFDIIDNRVTVAFGERDGIRVGHSILAINGENTVGTKLKSGEDVLSFLANESNYPVDVKFGRPSLASNEKIILSSMFHSLYAIGSQLSPMPKSSGIQTLESESFRLECFQTMSGDKFVVVSDPQQQNLDQLLHRIYELYSDYALKNPFYSLEQPIRCDLFDSNLQAVLEKFNKTGTIAV